MKNLASSDLSIDPDVMVPQKSQRKEQARFFLQNKAEQQWFATRHGRTRKRYLLTMTPMMNGRSSECTIARGGAVTLSVNASTTNGVGTKRWSNKPLSPSSKKRRRYNNDQSRRQPGQIYDNGCAAPDDDGWSSPVSSKAIDRISKADTNASNSCGSIPASTQCQRDFSSTGHASKQASATQLPPDTTNSADMDGLVSTMTDWALVDLREWRKTQRSKSTQSFRERQAKARREMYRMQTGQSTIDKPTKR